MSELKKQRGLFGEIGLAQHDNASVVEDPNGLMTLGWEFRSSELSTKMHKASWFQSKGEKSSRIDPELTDSQIPSAFSASAISAVDRT